MQNLIEFDGGTTCNIPSLGYGEGYGSYQINDAPIVRVSFGVGHSCNSAEILTLEAALADLAGRGERGMSVLVRGDSKIALKWVHCKKQPKPSTSPMFRDAIQKLRKVTAQFTSVKTEWRSREHSVRLFGH